MSISLQALINIAIENDDAPLHDTWLAVSALKTFDSFDD